MLLHSDNKAFIALIIVYYLVALKIALIAIKLVELKQQNWRTDLRLCKCRL